jgi:hypothetical protein
VSSFSLVSFPEFCRPSGSVRASGALHCPHVDDPDTQHMWAMPQSLQSLLSEAGEASSWRRR